MAGILDGNPSSKAVAVTPHDTNTIDATRGLYIGSEGNLTVTMKNNQDVTFANVPAGSLLPLRVVRVKASGTGASNIVAIY